MIRYSDPNKEKNLELAIQKGLIIRQIDPDGVPRYIITDQGIRQYFAEKGYTFA